MIGKKRGGLFSRASFAFLFILIVYLMVNGLFSQNAYARPLEPWFYKNGKEVTLRVEIFLTTTCPHCQNLDKFLTPKIAQDLQLQVNKHFINQDKSSLEDFAEYLQNFNASDYAVPSLFFCNTRWIGFADAATSGQELMRAFNYCRTQIQKEGGLTPETIQVLTQWSSANWINTSLQAGASPLRFISTLAFINALGLCSLFSFLVICSFVILQPSTYRQFGLPLLLILTLAGMQFLMINFPMAMFDMLLWLSVPSVLVGLGLLSYTLCEWKYVQHKGSSSSFITALMAVLTLIIVYFFQQTCIPNFTLVLRQWFEFNHFTRAQFLIYQGIYFLIFLLPLFISIFGLLYILTATRLAKYFDMARMIALILLGFIALFCILSPQLFAMMNLSLIVLILALVFALILRLAYFSR